MPLEAFWQQGACLPYGPYRVEEAPLIAYARALDPQPMHLDPASAQARQVGGLIASGWHTGAINHAMMLETLFAPGEVVALLGVPHLKWAAPARVGDVLSGMARVKRWRISRSRPGHVIVELALTLENQNRQRVLEVEERLLLRAPPPDAGDASLLPSAPEAFPRASGASILAPVQDMVPGAVLAAGEHRFEADFAREFVRTLDPLPGLADPHNPGVSGWHAAGRWLRQMVDLFHAREAAGEVLPQRGPGMGLENLIWHTPLRPGDTLHYASQVVAARPSASRPGWGVLTLRNHACNQHGTPVLAFTCFWLWEARLVGGEAS